MGFRINTNLPSLAAQRALEQTNMRLNSSLRKLSSGFRITRSGDDAAGLAISEQLKSSIRSVRQAKRNANDSISFIQIGEGGLMEISNMLIRLRELAMQASSDTIGNTERSFANIEFRNLKQEIDRIAKSTEFNGVKLLDGKGGQFEFQIGIRNNPKLDRFIFNANEADATIKSLKIEKETIRSKGNARQVLTKLDNALVRVNGMRANFGALQSRLISTIHNLAITDENLSAAKSRIVDVDLASESAELAKNTILQRAGVSVLSQANLIPQVALKLISGS